MQSKTHSFIEQIFNIGSGFLISCLIWAYGIRPAIVDGYMTIDDTMMITGIFTVVSIIRGYIWRRLFNNHTQKQYEKVPMSIKKIAEYNQRRKDEVLSYDFQAEIDREKKAMEKRNENK